MSRFHYTFCRKDGKTELNERQFREKLAEILGPVTYAGDIGIKTADYEAADKTIRSIKRGKADLVIWGMDNGTLFFRRDKPTPKKRSRDSRYPDPA